MKKLIKFVFLGVSLGVSSITSGAEIAVVLDAPQCIVADANTLKAVSSKLEKKIALKGYSLSNLIQTNTLMQSYRKNSGNDKLDLQRHDGMSGYANALTVDDLQQIGKANGSDYVLSIESVGRYDNAAEKPNAINLNTYATLITGKMPSDTTKLNVTFEIKLFKVDDIDEVKIEKYVISQKGPTPYSVKDYDKFYKRAFMYGINNADFKF